jgi:RNA polymerase sigma factor (sigma-70 family)
MGNMSGGPLFDLIHRVRRAAAVSDAREVADADLLERFVTRRDEAAFEVLVRRHGPMVHSVCRHLLRDPHDTEDAFQATFLVLVRKAASLQRRPLLYSWLYRVAYRIAVRARANAARRRAYEKQGVAIVAARSCDEEMGRDWKPILHEEVHRLPEKYRAPVLLCYLQGKTNEEAARQLGWPVGTVKGRLSRARELLRGRLTRRGVTLATGTFATTLSETLAPAAVPVALVNNTLKAAALIAAGEAVTAGLVSFQAAALTKGALQAMFLTKLTIVTTALLTVSAAGTGAVLWTLPGKSAPAQEVQRHDPVPQVVRTGTEPAPKGENSSEAGDLKRARANMKALVVAMHGHYDVYGNFPPAAVVSTDGNPLLSWRVLLLPYLGEGALFKEFKLDEPWDSPHNHRLLVKMPKVFAPVHGKDKDGHVTFYQVFMGKRTLFEDARGSRIQEVKDGTSNTIMLVEAANPVLWTKPAELPYAADKPLPKLGGMFKDIFLFVTADGQVHVGKKDFDEHQMRCAIVRDDGMAPGFDKIVTEK